LHLDRIVIGGGVTMLCLAGLRYDRWFLSNTKKGEWLVHRFGGQNALWILRALFCLGALFGILLACGVIQPVSW